MLGRSGPRKQPILMLASEILRSHACRPHPAGTMHRGRDADKAYADTVSRFLRKNPVPPCQSQTIVTAPSRCCSFWADWNRLARQVIVLSGQSAELQVLSQLHRETGTLRASREGSMSRTTVAACTPAHVSDHDPTPRRDRAAPRASAHPAHLV